MIRPKAICVFRRDDRILVALAANPQTGGRYARPLGGGIEFGERSEEALRREIREELGAEMRGPRLLGVIENIFELERRTWHEIVFVFDAEFADASLYNRPELPVNEAACIEPARWVPLAAFGDDLPLYPRGLVELLMRDQESDTTTRDSASG
jgi:ADP-ribose pyrophosphatase YjhB (NUDIX family)